MHLEAFSYVSGFVAAHGPFTSVVEIGSRNINGGIRGLLRGCTYTGVDIAPGPGVDVVADAATWRPSEPVECVICCEVLEHHPDPRRIVRAAWEMLRPGGWLCLTTATDPRDPHSGVDGEALREGEWYRNIAPVDLIRWAHDFETVAVDVLPRGDLRATARR